jgi:hypothetical protein
MVAFDFGDGGDPMWTPKNYNRLGSGLKRKCVVGRPGGFKRFGAGFYQPLIP